LNEPWLQAPLRKPQTCCAKLYFQMGETQRLNSADMISWLWYDKGSSFPIESESTPSRSWLQMLLKSLIYAAGWAVQGSGGKNRKLGSVPPGKTINRC
jgi:hypothetical protein